MIAVIKKNLGEGSVWELLEKGFLPCNGLFFVQNACRHACKMTLRKQSFVQVLDGAALASKADLNKMASNQLGVIAGHLGCVLSC